MINGLFDLPLTRRRRRPRYSRATRAKHTTPAKHLTFHCSRPYLRPSIFQ